MKNIIKAWAGLVNHELDSGWFHPKYQDGLYGIFKTRKEAKQHYENVIPVEIHIPIPKPKRKPKQP